MLTLSDELAARIHAHAAQTYPHECCGALLGRNLAGRREVLALAPFDNRRTDSPQNRFSLAAEDVRAAELAARERGLEVIGWYHSHPDHPARPSEYDREHAWPWYSYVIVSSGERQPQSIASWRLADDRSRFDAEPIEHSVSAAARSGEIT